jgi:hypothetical protein
MLALGGNFSKGILYFCRALGLEAIGFELRQFMPVHASDPCLTSQVFLRSCLSALANEDPQAADHHRRAAAPSMADLGLEARGR